MTPHVLFCGLGGVGQRHLRNLRQIWGDSVRVSAFRTRRETTLLSDQLQEIPGGNLEREYDVRVFDDLDEALGEGPTIAVIANPTSMHVSVAGRALRAGCDLFVEKPLSHDLEGVDELIALAEETDRICMVTYQLRFHPAVKRLFEEMDARRLGRVFTARAEVAEYLPGFHPYEDYRRMYASRKELGGGVILTQIHELDLLYRLFGMPQQLFCSGGHVSSLEIDVEDSATSLLEYRLEGVAPLAVQLHQDYLGRPARRSLCIFGEEGQLLLDLRAGSLVHVANDGKEDKLVDASEHPRNQLFLDELTHFLQCVETRTRPTVTLRDGAQSLRIALALKKSREEGTLVDLRPSGVGS